MRASPLSTFSVPVTPYGLLGNPANLEIRKRTSMSGLNISNANLAGLIGDIDTGVTYDAVSHGILLTSRVYRDLRVDMRAG